MHFYIIQKEIYIPTAANAEAKLNTIANISG